jgi:hypothetical protein
MSSPKVVVDFNNADAKGRVRLDCEGTLRDLARQKIQLSDGMFLTLFQDDADANGHPQQLVVDGSVEYSDEEKCWVAAIDWDAIQDVPMTGFQSVNGVAEPKPLSKVPSI